MLNCIFIIIFFSKCKYLNCRKIKKKSESKLTDYTYTLLHLLIFCLFLIPFNFSFSYILFNCFSENSFNLSFSFKNSVNK